MSDVYGHASEGTSGQWFTLDNGGGTTQASVWHLKLQLVTPAPSGSPTKVRCDWGTKAIRQHPRVHHGENEPSVRGIGEGARD